MPNEGKLDYNAFSQLEKDREEHAGIDSRTRQQDEDFLYDATGNWVARATPNPDRFGRWDPAPEGSNQYKGKWTSLR